MRTHFWACIAIIHRLLRPVGCAEISVPFGNGFTNVVIDGNSLILMIDSGSADTLVVYKDWFEEEHGKDACKKLPYGCYSCPDACDPFGDIHYVLEYGDGSIYTIAYHTGFLSLGGKNVGAFKFGLIIGFQPSPYTGARFPYAILGLSNGIKAGQVSVLEQLYARKVIPELAFQICAPTPPLTFSGVMTVGSSERACAIREKVTTVPLATLPSKSAQGTRLVSYGLVSSTKHDAFEKPLNDSNIFFDTGSGSLFLPESVFTDVKEKLVNFASRDSGKNVSFKVEGNVLVVGLSALGYLPVLTFSIGVEERPLELRILPKNYISWCNDRCRLRIVCMGKDIVIGRPFFASYFSGFDLKTAQLKVANYK